MTTSELAELRAITAQRRTLLRIVVATAITAALATVVAVFLATTETARADTPAAGAAAAVPAGDIVFTRQDGRGRTADLYTVNLDGSGLRRLTYTGNNFDAAYSPDGSQLAFASHRPERGGASEIYLMDADGTNVRRVTHSRRTRSDYTLNRHPTWSPDGTSIVYVSTLIRAGRLTSTSSTDLFQLDVATRTTRNITNAPGVEAWPSFAADGSLLYVRNGSIFRRSGDLELFVRKGTEPALAPDNGYLAYVDNTTILLTLGQSARKVADGSSPAWSRDGELLVFAAPDGLRSLAVGDGAATTRITRPAGSARHLAPTIRPSLAATAAAATASSAETAELAFSRGGWIHLMRKDGSGLRKLARGSAPAWSPDGSELAFARYDWISIIGADGRGERRLTRAGRGWGPAWSPDGKRIAFTSRRSGQFGVYVMNRDGSGVRRLAGGTRADESTSPAWSPDGRWLAFASTRAGFFNPEIYLVRPDGTGARRLTHTRGADAELGDDGMPSWSPDGKWIVFTSNRTQEGALWIMRADGSGERMLLDLPGSDDWKPSFTADGNRIVFTRQYADGRNELWTVGRNGRDARKLADGSDAAWRPSPTR